MNMRTEKKTPRQSSHPGASKLQPQAKLSSLPGFEYQLLLEQSLVRSLTDYQ